MAVSMAVVPVPLSMQLSLWHHFLGTITGSIEK